MKSRLFLFFFIILIIPIIVYANTDCNHECRGGLKGEHNIEIIGVDEITSEPVFRDTSEYFCERVSYCTETCTNPDELCKDPLKLIVKYEHTAAREGSYKIYTAQASTTFSCSDGSYYGPYTHSKQIKNKDCSEYRKEWNNAKTKMLDACKGIEYPERLLDKADKEDDKKEDDKEPCYWIKETYDRAKADLERVENKIAELKYLESELDLLNTQIQNKKQTLADFEGGYESLQEDVQKAAADLQTKKAEYDSINLELNMAWGGAIIGTAGPIGMAYGIGSAAVNLLGYVVTEIFGGEGDAGNVAGSSAGVVSDVADEVAGMVIDDALSGSPTDLLARNAGKLGKAGRSVDDLIGGASPGIGVLGAAVDGIELERLIAKLKAAESEYLKALDRYNSAVALAENSPLSISEEELVALKAEISQLESKKQELELKKIELDSLKSQLPTLKKTRDLQKEMYEECLEQYQSDSSKSEQEKACREAMIFEKEKKKQYDDCMAEN